MNNEYHFNIDKSLINTFSSSPLNEIIEEYHPTKLFELHQIHSNIINIVDDNYQNNLAGDGMITNLKNIALVIKTADCIPIILYDSKKQVLAVVHSGWKGTMNSIVKDTISKMVETYNVDVNDLSAYLYPSIRKCHFEVENDVYLQFKNKVVNTDKYITKIDNKYHIDLQSIIIDDIKSSGVTNISDSHICTYCNHDKYHSYRYNHTDKRNYLVAMIKE